MNQQCDNLILYFYQELGVPERQAFKTHLTQCLACKQELAFLQAAQNALQAPAAPQTVVEHLFAKTTRRRTFFAAWKPALVSVLLLGAGILVFVAGQNPTASLQDGQNALAYVTSTFDEEYENLAVDLQLFEEEF